MVELLASPEFTARVQQSKREIRVQEAIETARKQVESRSGRLKERGPELSKKLGLAISQEGTMETALVTL